MQAWTGTTMEPFVIGSLWGNLSDDNKGTLVSTGASFTLKDGDHLALVPGVDLDAFVELSPDNPEHALFLLQLAPAKSCAS